MRKKPSIRENFHVVVEPRRLGNFGFVSVNDSLFGGSRENIAKRYEERCEQIAEEIKRHVDNVGYITIMSDQNYVCPDCGSGWTEESDTYNGGCCDEDEANNPNAERAA